MNKTQDRIKEAATPATNGTSKETTPQTQEQKDKALIAKLRSLNKELQEQIEKELGQPDPDSDEAKAILSSDSEKNEDTNNNDGGGSCKGDGNCRRQDCP